jgi:hypothetical protein
MEVKMVETLKCPCGKKVTYDNSECYSIGDSMKKTGFTAYTTYIGQIIWLCPECSKRARKLAEELMKVMGSDDFYFPLLLKEGRLHG